MTVIFQIPYQTGVSFIADKRRIRKINGRTVVPDECKNDAEKLFGFNNVIVGFYGTDYISGTTYVETIKKILIEFNTDISIEDLENHLLNVNTPSLGFASTSINIREANFLIAIKENKKISSYIYMDGKFKPVDAFCNVGIAIYLPIFSIIKEELSFMTKLKRTDTELLGAILIDMFYKHQEYKTITLEKHNKEEIIINHSRDGGLNAISLDLNSGVTDIIKIDETPNIVRFLGKLNQESKIK